MKTPPNWADCAKSLIDVAMGREPADTVIRNGKWVNVYSGEIIPATDIAIKHGRFAYVGPDASHTVGNQTHLIEADDRYLVPGLCDAHMHVESGMVTVTEFSRAVIPHGTTSMFIDPHEIGNVLGMAGVKLMHDEAMDMPINVYVQMPSCVPSAPGLEHAGAELGVADVQEAMQWPNIIGLGEVMNFPGVTAGDSTMLGEIAATQAMNKTVGGHYASPDLGRAFHAYAASGAADDHEGTRLEDVIARVRQGMRAMLRLGSAWYDVAPQIKAVTEHGLDPRNIILCTDDSHSGTLINDGHMNRVVRHAIAQGLAPVTAIQMATLNTAQHFGLERELGSIAPGRRADLILSSDLTLLPIETVIARGKVVAEHGQLAIEIAQAQYPESATNTVHLGKSLSAADFAIVADEQGVKADAQSASVQVIGVIENQAPTKALIRDVPVANGLLEMNLEADVCQIALVERHQATGAVQNAFVSGFGYQVPCALASTVAHDSHHMIVVGTDRELMAQAANRLGEVGGGVTLFTEAGEAAMVELPIAGLMSNERAEIVAEKAQQLVVAMKACGCELNNAYMQHSLLALVVIPELRLSDVGLIDVVGFKPTTLVAS